MDSITEMARRVLASVVETPADRGAVLNGHWDETLPYRAAFAAIKQTTEAAAKLANSMVHRPHDIPEALRAGEHLKG